MVLSFYKNLYKITKNRVFIEYLMKEAMKKFIAVLVVLSSSYLSAITSTMTHRVVSTEPLLYSMIDYSKQQLSIEAAPFYLSMYDTQHTNKNLILNGKSTLTLDQQGGGDINPTWLNLISNNDLANYNSEITLTPQLSQGGVLLHLYKEYKKYYFDIRTAILECSTQIKIEETGGQNGAIDGISNALQAFTQPNWNYGKIGDSNQVAGLDDIQFKIGGKYQINSDSFDIYMTGFGLLQAPTGTGTKSEWLFEPQIGTNHWGIGAGFEVMMDSSFDLKFLIGGDYRYFMPAWEVRSFDLLNNGQWSRYLALQDTYGLPTAPITPGNPGINYFTQNAKIEGRNQINLYTRLEKQFRHCAFELSYNFFYNQQETINEINNIDTGYGICALTGPAGGGCGVTTGSTGMINQDVTNLDAPPVVLTTGMFDKASAQAQSFTSNSLMVRIQRNQNTYNYGIGANIEVAQSAGALSSWSVWAKFEYLFSKASIERDHINNSPEVFESFNVFNDIQDVAPAEDYQDESSIPSIEINNDIITEILPYNETSNEIDNLIDDIDNNESEGVATAELIIPLFDQDLTNQDMVDIIIADGEIYDDFIIDNDVDETLEQDDDNEILSIEALIKETLLDLSEIAEIESMEENFTEIIPPHDHITIVIEEPTLIEIENNDTNDTSDHNENEDEKNEEYYDENDFLILEDFLMQTMIDNDDIYEENNESYVIAIPEECINNDDDMIVNIDITDISSIESLEPNYIDKIGFDIPTEN